YTTLFRSNVKVMCISPIRLHRRQLHAFCPSKGNKRRPYGGTMSMGLKRGSLVKHKEIGLVYGGGTRRNRISLHDIENGERIGRGFKSQDCRFLTYNYWKI